MSKIELYKQYLYEKALYERAVGNDIMIPTFKDWVDIKKINCNQSTLKIFKELLGHTSQDIDMLE